MIFLPARRPAHPTEREALRAGACVRRTRAGARLGSRPRRSIAHSLAAIALLALCGCAQNAARAAREVPVHVWLSMPDLAASGGSVDALVYVGAQKVVEGPLVFAPGVPTLVFPPVLARTGERLVQVVLAGGSITASEDVDVEGETWVHVTVSCREAHVEATSAPPPLAPP